MFFDDSRRLTGPNLFSDLPGAVMEVYFDGEDPQKFEQDWRTELAELLQALDLPAEVFCRHFEGGVNIGFTALEDMLYTACEINETAFFRVQSAYGSLADDTEVRTLEVLAEMLADERNPELLKLIAAANDRGVTYLTDDDEFSLGMGSSSDTWDIADIPNPNKVDFTKYYDVPVAFVTGTNGKSTSVRMADAVAKAAGHSSGITSTDFIRAGDEILDRGDYSGPGGARTLIRHKTPDMVILEVARGGMLRRGLGVHKARAALITNVADDHLGQYGILTVPELVGAKGIVSRSLNTHGTLVLNADDDGLVNYFKAHPDLVRGNLIYFSLSPDNPVVQAALNDGKTAIVHHSSNIEIRTGDNTDVLMPVSDIPTTLNGAAEHNVANAMGVTGLCLGLGVEKSAIAQGLANFKGDANDNPGRGNYFDVNGAQVLIDFAHNPHSLTAIVKTAKAMPAKRRLIMIGHAGDRTDRDIRNLTATAIQMNPDVVITAEIPDYLRGRELHEIPDLMRDECIKDGLSDDQVVYSESCLAGAEYALEWAEPGDFILLLALDQRDKVFELLQ